MELVASGFSDHHDGAAVRPAVFGRVRVDVELELGHAVDNRVVDHLAGLRLQHADAVVEVLVRARAAAVDPRKKLAVRQRHARRQRHQRNEVAPVQRQRLDPFLSHVQAHLPAGRLQQRRGGGDIDRLGGLADLQLHVERRPVRKAQDDARLAVCPEARSFDGQYVGAGGQPEEVILAPLVGKSGVPRHRGLVLGLDFRRLHRAARGILNRAGQFGAARLPETHRRSEDQSQGQNYGMNLHGHESFKNN